ncbi:phenylalanyl-tRNA synthetase alpha chain [Candidatus Photodesmus katoptron]|uniref:Phenylalanine--tRNA ligase alpha subunit n=1 Tax=Candidatus Photodesmus katoptron Akat1 TaxID=1236703 RepID=S3EHG2_9GAMM|nr:phenylalanine--tRNA ligase subunit alpha [Candidatus Photodesmus katoptron]EPE37623.1 phenylalanyl-tRNA, alpha chain [Candidatus Photodesmus katoptron Akat1]KEY90658.1 phenylalanyl-tRNA synthetase alpha chain [Candidatus Photodesmus katoptron]
MQYLKDIITNATIAIKSVNSLVELDKVRIQYLGRKGELTCCFQNLSLLPPEKRADIAKTINKTKEKMIQIFNLRKAELKQIELLSTLNSEKIDITLPGKRINTGSIHPVTHTIERVECFFTKLGFDIESGPEIEDAFHNFDALNIKPMHPARTDQDTFFFNQNLMLRTHTSGAQIRIMENSQPPFRYIVPGRVYRNDYDKTHTPMFHQLEGILVNENINFLQLKGILNDFVYDFFKGEEKIELRFRPSYFPFTEPSAEIDIKNKNGEWLEILGCGMVHPNVFHSVGINSEKYSGFAFGIGIERLAMLAYGIHDLRSFFENDLRFLKQFK